MKNKVLFTAFFDIIFLVFFKGENGMAGPKGVPGEKGSRVWLTIFI